MRPSVSVIIPCYNSVQYVGEAIESVLAQSCPASEVLVVDDGSRDASADAVRVYGKTVRLIQQPNQGVSAARNHALREATSDYVLFLDADDALTPDALQRLSSATDRGRNVVLMGYRECGPGPHRTDGVMFDEDGFFPGIIAGNFGPNHTRLVPRASAVAAGGFPVGMKIYEDWHFWTRVGLLGTPLVSLDFIGGIYRRHEASCLAAPNERDVAAAHVAVATLQCERVPRERPDVLAKYGHQLFWSGWTAYRRACAARLPRPDVRRLATAVRGLTRAPGFGGDGGALMHLTRVAGLPTAEALRSLFGGPNAQAGRAGA